MTPAAINDIKAQAVEQSVQNDAPMTDEPILSNIDQKASVENLSLVMKHSKRNSINSREAENLQGDENGDIADYHHSILGAQNDGVSSPDHSISKMEQLKQQNESLDLNHPLADSQKYSFYAGEEIDPPTELEKMQA